jgi:hypothetical protein
MCGAVSAQSAGNDSTPAVQAPAGNQANASSGAPQSSTVLKATTRLVIVDVVATDGKGVPITDLSAKDFVVTENGSPQEVRVFSFESPTSGSRQPRPWLASQPSFPIMLSPTFPATNHEAQ